MNNEKFSTKNLFSQLAYLACEKHVEGQELKHPLGKLDCYIFYSTYVSLLTSYIELSNTDNVDIYLMEGLEKFVEYLKIDIDALPQYQLENYIKARSNFYVTYFKDFSKYNFTKITNYPHFLKCFEIEDPYFENFENYELKYIDPFDIISLQLTFNVVLDNINIIDKLYDTFREVASDYKLKEWKNNKPRLLDKSFDFIEKLVINPFEESRCNICGNFELREQLSLVPISDSEFGSLLLPVCQSCKGKHINSEGWIEF